MLIKGNIASLEKALSPVFTKRKFHLTNAEYNKLMSGKAFKMEEDYRLKNLLRAGKAVEVEIPITANFEGKE